MKAFRPCSGRERSGNVYVVHAWRQRTGPQVALTAGLTGAERAQVFGGVAANFYGLEG